MLHCPGKKTLYDWLTTTAYQIHEDCTIANLPSWLLPNVQNVGQIFCTIRSTCSLLSLSNFIISSGSLSPGFHHHDKARLEVNNHVLLQLTSPPILGSLSPGQQSSSCSRMCVHYTRQYCAGCPWCWSCIILDACADRGTVLEGSSQSVVTWLSTLTESQPCDKTGYYRFYPVLKQIASGFVATCNIKYERLGPGWVIRTFCTGQGLYYFGPGFGTSGFFL